MTVDHGDNSPNIKNPLAISVPLVLFGEKSRVRLKKKKKKQQNGKKKKNEFHSQIIARGACCPSTLLLFPSPLVLSNINFRIKVPGDNAYAVYNKTATLK